MTEIEREKQHKNFLKKLNFDFQTKGGDDTFAYVVTNSPYLSNMQWNEQTQESYANYFNDYLLPKLSKVPMEELHLEDLEDALTEIQTDRATMGLEAYSDSVMNKMRYLIRLVFNQAAEMKVISHNCVWGSPDYGTVLPADDDKSKKKELVVLRKSLTVKEERAAFEQLLSDPIQNGREMGLALMYALGLRNAEACGATFGAVREMTTYPGNYTFTVIKTTIGNTSRLKAGGKTNNTPRKLPMPDALVSLILKRKEFLEEKLQRGEICLGKGQTSVDSLPIACLSKGVVQYEDGKRKIVFEDTYTEHCRRNDLNAAGKAFLKSIGIDEAEVAFIEKNMDENERYSASEKETEVEYREKDPTAYLFRRNNGTHLALIGLNKTEIEAYMGHAIIDEEVQKNDMENEDLLYKIKKKLNRRPFLSNTDVGILTIEPEYSINQIESAGDCTVKLNLQEKQPVGVTIIARESNQDLDVSIVEKEDIRVEGRTVYVKQPIPEDISIYNAYRDMYTGKKEEEQK